MVIGLVQVEFISDKTKFPFTTVLLGKLVELKVTSKSKSRVSLVEFCVVSENMTMISCIKDTSKITYTY